MRRLAKRGLDFGDRLFDVLVRHAQEVGIGGGEVLDIGGKIAKADGVGLVLGTRLVVTRGEQGCTVISRGSRVDVPAVPPARIEDPTGVGDAFRGGFMKGLATGASYEVCARMGSVAATYALEYLGGTSHSYTVAEFNARYAAHFKD